MFPQTGAAVSFLFLFPVAASTIDGGHPLKNVDVHSDRYTDNHVTSGKTGKEQARHNREQKQTKKGEKGGGRGVRGQMIMWMQKVLTRQTIS